MQYAHLHTHRHTGNIITTNHNNTTPPRLSRFSSYIPFICCFQFVRHDGHKSETKILRYKSEHVGVGGKNDAGPHLFLACDSGSPPCARKEDLGLSDIESIMFAWRANPAGLPTWQSNPKHHRWDSLHFGNGVGNLNVSYNWKGGWRHASCPEFVDGNDGSDRRVEMAKLSADAPEASLPLAAFFPKRRRTTVHQMLLTDVCKTHHVQQMRLAVSH